MNATRTTSALLLSALLAACAPTIPSAPEQASIALPVQWAYAQESAEATADAAPRIHSGWWQDFGDAVLNQHVQSALAGNTQLLLAGSRMGAARAQLELAHAALLPNVNLGLGSAASRSLTPVGISNSRAVQPQLQASWELDLWNRLGDREQAARLQYQASQAEREAVRLSIAAAVAQAYIDWQALRAQLAQTQGTVALRSQALRIAQDQEAAGYISNLQASQASAEYEAVKQQLPALTLAIARTHNALMILTGAAPDAQDGAAQASAQEFASLHLPDVPRLLPSQMLRRRPDLLQAELQLSASDASLRASRSAFLPSVNLSASAGRLFVNALDYNPLTVWSLGASVLAPLFDGGRLSAQFEQATAARDQAALNYRGAVLTALGEVESALAGVDQLKTQGETLQRRKAVLTKTLVHAKDRYESGYASYIEQIDAERSLYAVEVEAISVRQQQLNNMIALHRALGGGFEAPTQLN